MFQVITTSLFHTFVKSQHFLSMKRSLTSFVCEPYVNIFHVSYMTFQIKRKKTFAALIENSLILD